MSGYVVAIAYRAAKPQCVSSDMVKTVPAEEQWPNNSLMGPVNATSRSFRRDS